MNRPCPKWLENAVFYEIYPQSFCDSNGDGIGDLQGIIEKLDYIKDLGCNAIWMNPCFLSPFQDAGYDVADFYRIAPRYGTNDDAKKLFAEAAKRGIKVCLDLVAGHTSIEHEWFKQSCKPEHNKYSNWYVWTNSIWDAGDWTGRFVGGYAQRDGQYLNNFFYCQPALNYGFANPDPNKPWQLPMDHPDCLAVRQELKNIIKFWLDMGATGFRVDMAKSLIKNDPDSAVVAKLWNEVREWLDADYPEAVLISEWGDPVIAIPAGFHIDFLFQLHVGYNSLFRYERDQFCNPTPENHSFFRKEGKGDITLFLDQYMNYYRKTKDKGYVSLISGNHDIGRCSQGCDSEDLKLIFAFLLTMPGVPFIYYGDEIGMRYLSGLPSKEGGFHRTGARTPMQWSAEANAGFSTADPSKLYLPVDPSPDAPNVADQQGKPDSLLETVRALIKLRKDNPALCADGEFSPVYWEPNGYPFVFLRTLNGERMLVAFNPSGKPAEVEFQITGSGFKNELMMGKGAHIAESSGKIKLKMDGVSYGVFKL
ncbi:MAG: alpha-amylase family glycosyl hydrolase [Armatimonadota bacterium]